MRILHYKKIHTRTIAQFVVCTLILTTCISAIATSQQVSAATAKTIFDINLMQEMTPQICANTTTPTPAARQITTSFSTDVNLVPTTTLIDTRDGKTYRISKLADGNCWMTQNLDLGDNSTDANPLVLTPVNTDITQNFTMPVVQTEDGVDWSEDINNSHFYDFSKHPVYASQAKESGNLYNWHIATAGSGSELSDVHAEANQSICPKGWKLPSSITYKNNSFYNMIVETYGLRLSGSTGVSALISNPFSFTPTGYYATGKLFRDETRGVYWSSTNEFSANAYSLSIDISTPIRVFSKDSGLIAPQRIGFKKYEGLSIRCIVPAADIQPEINSNPTSPSNNHANTNQHPNSSPSSDISKASNNVASPTSSQTKGQKNNSYSHTPRTFDANPITLVIIMASSLILIFSIVIFRSSINTKSA